MTVLAVIVHSSVTSTVTGPVIVIETAGQDTLDTVEVGVDITLVTPGEVARGDEGRELGVDDKVEVTLVTAGEVALENCAREVSLVTVLEVAAEADGSGLARAAARRRCSLSSLTGSVPSLEHRWSTMSKLHKSQKKN